MSTGAAKRRQQKSEDDALAAFPSESGSPELRAFPSETDPSARGPLESTATGAAARHPPPSSRWMAVVRVAGAAAVGVALGLLYPTFLPSPPESGPAPPAPSNTPPAPATSSPVPAERQTSQPAAPAKPPSVVPPTPAAAARPNDAAVRVAQAPRAAPPAIPHVRGVPAIGPPFESASPLVRGVIPPAVAEPIVPDAAAPPAPAVEARVNETPALTSAPIPDSDDRPRIRAILDAYSAAYERLDAVSPASLWPGVDTRALTRAFSTLSRQNVSFDRCEITVDGARATAQCDGAIEYVRRVGDSTPHSRTTSWAFAFDRAAGTWRISNVTAR